MYNLIEIKSKKYILIKGLIVKGSTLSYIRCNQCIHSAEYLR